MPPGAVYVGRPTVWGNPFAVTRSSDFHGLPGSWFVRGEDGAIHHPDHDTQTSARHRAVELFAAQVLEPSGGRVDVELVRAELAGRDLVCWCPLREPCHADVLLAVANSLAAEVAVSDLVAPGNCPRCGVPRLADRRLASRAPEDQSVTARPPLVVCPHCGHLDGTMHS